MQCFFETHSGIMRFLATLAFCLLAVSCGDSEGDAAIGTELGKCYPNGTCNGGLVCSASAVCVKTFDEDEEDSLTTNDACAPDCTGKQCGDDGCGNLCGACGAGKICSSGSCLLASCGNGAVDQGEECDDGNTANGDGCNVQCREETLEALGDDEPWGADLDPSAAPVNFSECDDETGTGQYAPGDTLKVRLCVVSYLDQYGYGFSAEQVAVDVQAAQEYYSVPDAGIWLHLEYTDVLQVGADQTDPGSDEEIDALLEGLREHVDAAHPGECDAVAGYVNSITKSNGTKIGGKATWPFKGLHSTILTTNNAKFAPGETIAHELGHVFGLYHTFQDPDDGCTDTPFDANCNEGNHGECFVTCNDGTSPPAWNVMAYFHCLTPNDSSLSNCQIRRARCFVSKMFKGAACQLPVLKGPPEGSSFAPGDAVTFSWELGNPDVDHSLKVRFDPPNGPEVLNQNVGTKTMHTASGDHFEQSGSYRWTVEYPSTCCENGSCSAVVRTFTVTEIECLGPPEEACGDCGVHYRECQPDGTWTNWGPCQGQGVCTAGTPKTCSNGDNVICTNDCDWPECPGCGDGKCSGNETKCNCKSDCGTCNGCCSDTVCKPGNSNNYCGKGGQSCQGCSGGKVCTNGSCDVDCGDGQCNGSETECTCPDDCGACSGCCSGSICQSGNTNSNCGKGGQECQSCSSGKVCTNGSCDVNCGDGQCNGSETECSCPGDCGSCSGCCSGSTCQSGTSDSYCGKSGNACQSCSGGKECENKQCVTPPPKCGDGVCNGTDTKCNCASDCGSCSGCCSGSTCQSGTSDSYCGKSGNACQSCSGGKECENKQCVTPPPKCGDGVCNGTDTKCNCASDCGSCSGCCSGSTCQSGTSDSYCGKSGNACQSCSGGKDCENGNCVDNTTTVYSVSPTSAAYGSSKTFTVSGKNLPSTIIGWIGDCDDLTTVSKNSTTYKFKCTPKWGGAGIKDGIIKSKAGGTVLKEFTVNVTCSSPKIVDIEPLTAYLNQTTTFTAAGACLPGTIVAWIGNCENLTYVHKMSHELKFKCKPTGTKGNKEGLIKTKSGGTTIKSFTLNVK